MFGLRPYQERTIAGVRRSLLAKKKRILVVAPTGAGKCLGRDTPVLMFDGSIKLVQDVAVGDLLMGPDSKPRRVESLARGREMMYRVVPTKGDPYVVNESHILSLKITGMGHTKSVKAGDGSVHYAGDIVNISVSDYLKSSITFKHVSKGWRAAVDFDRCQELPIPAYIFGAWIGDGHSHHLQFTTADSEIFDEVERYAKSIGMRVNKRKNSNLSVILDLVKDSGRYGRAGSPFGNALRKLKVFKNKFIPDCYKTASRHDRLEFLAGIIDTDGHYDGKGFAISQKSEGILDSVLFIARSLGFSAYKSKVRKTCYNNGVSGYYFQCQISGDLDKIPTRIKRKKASPRGQKKDVLVSGIKLEPLNEDDYFGFELSGPDRLFLLGDFTVTHNTIMFSHITKSCASKSKRVLILAHRDLLIRQASGKLRENGVRHGVIMAGFTPDYTVLVQVGSVQTLVRRLGKMRWKPDYVIIDEAHLSAAASYLKIVEHFRDAIVMGFTGSPIRLDGKPLGASAGGLYDDLVQECTVQELVGLGFLVPTKVFGAVTAPDFSKVDRKGNDWDVEQMAAVMDEPGIIGDSVTAWQQHALNVPTVAWCCNINHANDVAAAFNAAGVASVVLTGEDSGPVRQKALNGLETGEVKIIAFVGILIEGVDCPAIGCIMLLRRTMSLASYLQVIGRGLRPYTSPAGVKKEYCIVLDQVNLWQIHGFAEDVRQWDLDQGELLSKRKKKEKEEDGKIQCKSCYRVIDKADVCPHCGEPTGVVRKTRTFDQVDGELIEITKETREEIAKRQKDEVKKAKTREELTAIAVARGYKPGWVNHQLELKERGRTGTYRRRQSALPPPPSDAQMALMSLDELVKVANEQGWPVSWAHEHFNKRGF